MQIIDIFHNCPEQQQQQQSDPKDLGSKFPRSKTRMQLLKTLAPLWCFRAKEYYYGVTVEVT